MERNFYLICFKKIQEKFKLLLGGKALNRTKITIMYFCILQGSLQKIKPKPYKEVNTSKRSQSIFPFVAIYFCVVDPFHSYLALLIPILTVS